MAAPHLLFALTGGGKHDPTQAQGQGREEVLMANAKSEAAWSASSVGYEPDCRECAELRAENARLRTALAARQQDIAALQRWGADRLPQATVDARKLGYGFSDEYASKIGVAVQRALARDQFDRNCRASVGVSTDRDEMLDAMCEPALLGESQLAAFTAAGEKEGLFDYAPATYQVGETKTFPLSPEGFAAALKEVAEPLDDHGEGEG